MTDWSDWPLGERRSHAPEARPVARGRRRARPPWAPAVAAFVAGVLLTAIAFSAGWRHQAQHSSTTDTALAAATARTQRLAGQLRTARARTAHAQAQLAAARKAKAEAATAAQAVSKDASTLADALVATGRSADSVSLGAGAIGSDVDRLASELKTLTTYLSTTPAGQIDAGYVASQTAYLTKQLGELKGAQSDLAAAVDAFDASAKDLSDRAAKLSGSN